MVALFVTPAHSATHAKSKPELVYIAPHGKVYHPRDCMALKHLKHPRAVTREQARKMGRRECYYCFPDHAANKKAKR
jgi:hypothetical protein